MPISIDNFTESVRSLIRNFEADKAHHLSKGYLEAQARIDFITPFFEALGWDVRNQAGLPFQGREVMVEKGESDMAGRPDYSFRVAGQTKFFVEAKAPSEGLDHPKHIMQAKQYAWNTRQVFFVVLTDFAEFRFYDASIRPDERKPDEGLLLKIAYADYLRNAEKLWEFSKERVTAGSLDAMLPRDLRTQRLRIPVDQVFLDEMTGWRSDLARDIYKNNPGLKAKQLNEVVQRLLDRIVFIRIAEDRHIIEKRQLADAVDEWKARGGKYDISGWLRPLFENINDDFNGEIFKPNQLLDGVKVDSEVLARIIDRLYPPKSPYRFDVIGVELLGSIYERYLGNTIRTTDHQVRVEEKPEVRKAGGVYYTPQYVVDYIVKETVSRLIEGKTPNQIEKLRIVDPACGSGSFLISAFQCLIDYHVRYLAEHREEAHVHPLFPDLVDNQNGEPRLSVIRKAKILRNNLYGVDIDPQAVEITMMSLYLKALEGERSLLPPKQHLLPELKYNIICGNSLVGRDFDEQLKLPLDDAERDRINIFDWNEQFSETVKSGGFDAVIGNPPWGGDIDKELKYFHQRYPATTKDHTDSFKLFIEAGIEKAGTGRFVSMIVPNTVLRQRRLRDVRELLLQTTLLSVVDLGENVFKGVVAPSCVFVLKKAKPSRTAMVSLRDLHACTPAQKELMLSESPPSDPVAVRQSVFGQNKELEFMKGAAAVSSKIRLLGEVTEFKCKDAGINYQRVKVGMRVKGNSDLSSRLLYEGDKQRSIDHMYWKGSDIDRYWVAERTTRFCRPDVRLRKNEVVHLNETVYGTAPKLLLRQTADSVIATIDYRGIWFGRSVISITFDSSSYRPEYLLGLLNSRYLNYLYHQLVHEIGRVFAPSQGVEASAASNKNDRFFKSRRNCAARQACHARRAHGGAEQEKALGQARALRTGSPGTRHRQHQCQDRRSGL